jgi:hypothetical protein
MGPVALCVHRSQSGRAYVATRWGRTGPTGSRGFRLGSAPYIRRRRDQDGSPPDGAAAHRSGPPGLPRVRTAALGQEAPLFFKPPEGPSRNPQYRGPAVAARERLAAWVREQGVTDPGISPNHAWRHLFKTRARRPRELCASSSANLVVGHAEAHRGELRARDCRGHGRGAGRVSQVRALACTI